MIERVERMLSEDVPKLMCMIPQEEQNSLLLSSQAPGGNNFFSDQSQTPFEIGGVEGINAGQGEHQWIVEKFRQEYDEVFAQLSPQNGKISGAAAKQEMVKSKLVRSLAQVHIQFLSFALAEQCARSDMETE